MTILSNYYQQRTEEQIIAKNELLQKLASHNLNVEMMYEYRYLLNQKFNELFIEKEIDVKDQKQVIKYKAEINQFIHLLRNFLSKENIKEVIEQNNVFWLNKRIYQIEEKNQLIEDLLQQPEHTLLIDYANNLVKDIIYLVNNLNEYSIKDIQKIEVNLNNLFKQETI